MIPQTTSALLATALFLLPGFVGQRYSEQTYALRSEGSGLRSLVLTLYYSLLSYLTLAALAIITGHGDHDAFQAWLNGDKQPWEYLLATVALLVISIALAEIGRQWRRSETLRPWLLEKSDIDTRHTVVSGWEWFFNTGKKAFVIVTLKDDTEIAGFYGADSYSGYTQDTPDLYLQQRWILDENGWFLEGVSSSLGVFIRAEEIKMVEFYDVIDDESDDETKHEQAEEAHTTEESK